MVSFTASSFFFKMWPSTRFEFETPDLVLKASLSKSLNVNFFPANLNSTWRSTNWSKEVQARRNYSIRDASHTILQVSTLNIMCIRELDKLNLIKHACSGWFGFRLEPILPLPQMPQKLTLASKVVRSDSKIIFVSLKKICDILCVSGI